MHSLHLPCLRQEVGTSMPMASAWSKSDKPGFASIDCPLIVSVTAIAGKFLETFGFEFRLHRFRYFARRTFALLFLAPFPLCEIIVGTRKPSLRRQLVNLFRELVVERQSHVFAT